MTTETRAWSNLAIHPGETLAEELDARALERGGVAARTGTSPRYVNDVIRGRKPISAEFALALEAELGIEAAFWMNLQTGYDLTVARLKREAAGPAIPR